MEHFGDWAKRLNTTEARGHTIFPGFCRKREFEFGNCTDFNCAANVVGTKVFRILYAMTVKLRNLGLESFLNDIIPTQEVELFHHTFLRRRGWGSKLTLDPRLPTS